MNRNYRNLTMVLILPLLFGGSKNQTGSLNTENEKLSVEKSIHSSIGWAQNKNINLLYSVIANDSSFLEVHPGSRIVKGFDELWKAEEFWMNPDLKAIRYEIRDLCINISRSGDVAW